MRDLAEYLDRVDIPAVDRAELLRKARSMRPSEISRLDWKGQLFRGEYNHEDEHGNPVAALDVPLGKAFRLSRSCSGWQAIAKAKVAR